MTGHTPGPWVSKWRAAAAEVYIIGPGKEPVATLIGFSSRPLAELEANGRLVAAAPDLYDALRGVLLNAGSAIDTEWLERATTAIAKAEGRSA